VYDEMRRGKEIRYLQSFGLRERGFLDQGYGWIMRNENGIL
jgi:hypothetical protein